MSNLKTDEYGEQGYRRRLHALHDGAALGQTAAFEPARCEPETGRRNEIRRQEKVQNGQRPDRFRNDFGRKKQPGRAERRERARGEPQGRQSKPAPKPGDNRRLYRKSEAHREAVKRHRNRKRRRQACRKAIGRGDPRGCVKSFFSPQQFDQYRDVKKRQHNRREPPSRRLLKIADRIEKRRQDGQRPERGSQRSETALAAHAHHRVAGDGVTSSEHRANLKQRKARRRLCERDAHGRRYRRHDRTDGEPFAHAPGHHRKGGECRPHDHRRAGNALRERQQDARRQVRPASQRKRSPMTRTVPWTTPR